MKTIAIIPARGGSKGIPRKNIIDFLGIPLLATTIISCQKSKQIQETYVTSDDDEILKIAQSFGAKAIKRPANLATDISSSEEALIHALDTINEPNIKNVVFLQATSPLREVKDIDSALEIFKRKELDSLFSASPAGDTCLWEEHDGSLKSVNYDYKNRKRRQDIKNRLIENGSFYIFKPEILLKNKNRLGGKIGFYLMEEWKLHEIDSYEDLELCKFLYERRINGE